MAGEGQLNPREKARMMLGLPPKRRPGVPASGPEDRGGPRQEGGVVADRKEQAPEMPEAKAERKTKVVDLDAFAEAPVGELRTVKFKGKVYRMRNLRDLAVSEVVDLLNIGRSLDGKPLTDQLDIMKERTRSLVPDLPVGELSAGQLDFVIGEAFRTEGEDRPQMGSEQKTT